ncbi:MAG: 30S ribosomal protein S18 [Opitutales bacterium]|nr:30S ribosomal protein S18 [Opitutales bacterium]
MAEEQKKSVMELSFEDRESLVRYTTETGKILPRKFTGLSAKEQRHIKKTIKQGRNMLLMK